MQRSKQANAILESLAANIRRGRARCGLTQEKLAEIVEVDLTWIQKLERGHGNPSLSLLIKIADALDTRVIALFRAAKLPEIRRGRPKRRAQRGTASRGAADGSVSARKSGRR